MHSRSEWYNLGMDKHAEPQLNSDSTSEHMTILSSTTGNQPQPHGDNSNSRSCLLDVAWPNSWIHQSPVSSRQSCLRHSSQRISPRLPAENNCEYVTIPGHAACSVTLQSTGEPVYVEIETRMWQPSYSTENTHTLTSPATCTYSNTIHCIVQTMCTTLVAYVVLQQNVCSVLVDPPLF